MKLTNNELAELLSDASMRFKSLPGNMDASEVVKQIQQALCKVIIPIVKPEAVNVYSNNCFTVNLDVFIVDSIKYKPLVCRRAVLHELKLIFDKINNLNMWPKATDSSEKILSLISQSFSLDYFNILINRSDNLLVVGSPIYVPLYATEVDKDKLTDAVKQFNEIDERYPNWMIQSKLPTEQL